MARRNPMPLVVFNPRRGPVRSTLPGTPISEKAAWQQVEELGRVLESARTLHEAQIAGNALLLLGNAMLRQLSFGVHANPRGGKLIGRHVQAIAYIHAKDGDAYVHGFGNYDPPESDLNDGWLNLSKLKTVTGVEAFYNDDGSVTLRHKDGKKLVGLFPE